VLSNAGLELMGMGCWRGSPVVSPLIGISALTEAEKEPLDVQLLYTFCFCDGAISADRF